MNTRRLNLGTPRAGVRALAWLMGVLVTTFVAVGATASPAQAKYYSGGMPSRTFNVKTVGINTTWVGFFDTARARWNNSGAGTKIGRTSSAASEVTAGRYSQSWYGLYSPHGLRSINRTFTIKVNARTLDLDAGSNYRAWVLSTSTHEFGHSVSLGDNPSSGNTSLMNYSRNRTVVGSPTAADVKEVKRIYS